MGNRGFSARYSIQNGNWTENIIGNDFFSADIAESSKQAKCVGRTIVYTVY